MAWHNATATNYQNFSLQLVQFACGKHVSSVTLSAPGTGYANGDVLTLPHASGLLTASVEVLTTSGGGAITTYALRNMGSYAIRVASVAVGSGGTGYAVNDQVRLVGGTFTCAAMAIVSSVSGGVVTGIGLTDGGGAYTVAPPMSGCTTSADVGTGSGTGLTLTTTTQAVIGTSGIAASGGTGTGAQFSISLTPTGWTAVRDRANFSHNAVTTEKEVVLQGITTTVTPPFVGMRTYTEAGSKTGVLLAGFSGHASGTAFGSLPSASPVTTPSNTAGTYVPILPGGVTYWFSVSPRRIMGVVKCIGAVTSYISFYAGMMNSYRTELEAAFPFFLGSSCAVANQAPDSTSINVTGIVEAASPSGVTGPCYWYRSSDATWREVKNNENNAPDSVDVLYPLGRPAAFGFGNAKEIVAESGVCFWNGIGLNTRSASTRALKPSLGTDEILLVPVTLISTPNGTGSSTDLIIGELDGVFWVSGTKSDGSLIAVESVMDVGGVRYRIFVNGAQAQSYTYWCMAEK